MHNWFSLLAFSSIKCKLAIRLSPTKYRFFGLIIMMSFCDFSFIKENFFFLKSTYGRGFFNIFCSFMFLIASTLSIWQYLMMALLAACGVFFIVMACIGKEVVGADIDSAKSV